MEEISVDDLTVNDYNPNEMTDSLMARLQAEIKRVGFLAPIIARAAAGKLIIIDGEHRYMAAKALGMTSVPVIVTDLTEEEAKIQTVNLNQIKGELNPLKYAKLLSGLRSNFSSEQIETYLGVKARELAAYEEILNSPKRDVRLVNFNAVDATNKPLEISFFITGEDQKLVQDALNDTGKPNKNEAFMDIIKHYKDSLAK
jgi:ParB family chromosome partitioning protein